MAKPTSQERRKQVLRQRRAEEQREADRLEAGYLFGDALGAHRAKWWTEANSGLARSDGTNPNWAELSDRARRCGDGMSYAFSVPVFTCLGLAGAGRNRFLSPLEEEYPISN